MTQRATIFLFIVSLAALPARAQDEDPFVTEWEFSQATETRPDYIGDAYYARGLAFGIVDDGTGTMVERLLVATNATGEYEVVVLDPDDGEPIGALSVDGIVSKSSGRAINDLNVTEDGIIIACSEVNNVFVQSETESFTCYRWDSLTDAPEVIVDFTPPDANADGRADWVGTLISTVGAASDNTLTLYTAAVRTSPFVYRFTTTDNGASFDVEALLTDDESSVTVEGVAPLGPGESAFYHNIAAQQPVLYDVDLEAAGQVPEFVVTPFSTSTKYFEAAGRAWLVIFNYEAGVLGQRAELIEVTDGPEAAFEYGNTGSLGAAENFQANGDVDFRINEDGTVSLFVLATNNGIGSYRTVETIAVSAETPRDIMYTAGFESVFPNPFEQEALVSFRVQEAGHVLLEVYDLLGRRVRTLVDGHRAAGVHAASLEAGDLAGGLYVLRLQNGDRTAARAVTLAR